MADARPGERGRVNGALIAAGCLGLLAAAIHGAGGELLVVRRLALEGLPTTRFGGTRMTKAMIHATWHVTTAAFLTVGVSLLVAGTALEGDTRQAVAIAAAASATGFAVAVDLLGFAHLRSLRHLRSHPGPIALTAMAALAWIGAL